MTLLLGIDIGTTATKVVLIRDNGQIVAETSRQTNLVSAQTGWAEEDPQQWWENICAAVPECLAQAGIDSDQVAGVGVSGMVPALVLLDGRGEILRPSIQQNDARAVNEIIELRRQTDEEDILARTGSAITQQSIGPKLLWLRRNEPEMMYRAAHVMGSYDYIVYRMTGEYSCESNWALESGLFDLHQNDWDGRLLNMAAIQKSMLGDVHWPADIAGKLKSSTAAEIGLRAETPVVTGSADHIASAFSAGIQNQGDLLVKLGGSGDLLYCVDQPMTDSRMYLDYHTIPGKYIFNGCMASSGSLIKWFRNEFTPNEDYPALDQAAEHIAPGCDGLILLPYFLGEKTPINNPLARGTLVGLTLQHTRSHLFRAILEGISYGFYDHLQVLHSLGLPTDTARVTNGGAHSILWKQITADVLGINLEVVEHHPGSSLGAAFIAGKGVSVFLEWTEIERFIKVEAVVSPDYERHDHYKKLFSIYKEIYYSLENIYPRIAKIYMGN